MEDKKLNEVQWTYVGVKDGKLYFYDHGEWKPAVDEAGVTKEEVQEMIDENINDELDEEF